MLTASTMINYHIILQVIREMWNCWACSKHNLTSKQLLNSLTIQLQTLKSQNVRGFSSLDFEQLLYDESKSIRQKIMWWKYKYLEAFSYRKISKWHIKMTRYQKWWPKMSRSTSFWCLKDDSLIKVPVKTSLRRAKLVSLT